MTGQIGQGSWQDAFHAYRDDVMTKIKKGATEEAIPTGGGEYTQSEWKKVLGSVDKQLDDIKEEQKERFAKNERKAEAQKIFEAATAGAGNPVDQIRSSEKVPYGYLAKDGLIEYNGVIFVCDEKTNSICLGDVSDAKNTLVIPLAEGGCLKVNRDNLGDLQRAIGMFSPEDVNRILRAIAQDNKAREMQQELEDEEADAIHMGADQE